MSTNTWICKQWMRKVVADGTGLAVLSQKLQKKLRDADPSARLAAIVDKLTEGSGILSRETYARSQLKKIEAVAGPAPEGTAQFLADLWSDSEWWRLPDDAAKNDAFDEFQGA